MYHLITTLVHIWELFVANQRFNLPNMKNLSKNRIRVENKLELYQLGQKNGVHSHWAFLPHTWSASFTLNFRPADSLATFWRNSGRWHQPFWVCGMLSWLTGRTLLYTFEKLHLGHRYLSEHELCIPLHWVSGGYVTVFDVETYAQIPCWQVEWRDNHRCSHSSVQLGSVCWDERVNAQLLFPEPGPIFRVWKPTDTSTSRQSTRKWHCQQFRSWCKVRKKLFKNKRTGGDEKWRVL